jgi:hypothetical protein
MSIPVLAVVGHPNKGKSSIVATLTRQDDVRISEISGTTTAAQVFDFSIDGVVCYQLVDTPGFQRPRQVLSWLQQHSPNAAERQQTLQAFVDEQSALASSRFQDELELLRPILAGAGVIYVVDGSLPYSPEFEAEMTILQWSGQPRMALINPIAGDTYVPQWQSALGQYFSVVRVFDPMKADFQKQLTVLSAFAELHEPWRVSIESTIERLQQYVQRLEQQGAFLVAEHLVQMLGHVSSVRVPSSFVESILEASLKAEYQAQLRKIEASMQQQLKALFAHSHMSVEGQTLETDYPDLFDSSHWYLYGLDRQKLVALSASAGAAAGAVLDAGVGGASMMTGAIAGGLLSGLASLAATFRPDKLRIKGIPLAGKTLTAGPTRELTFIFVLLGRAVSFLEMILRRTHADRSVAAIKSSSMSERIRQLPAADQVKLTRLLQKAHKGLGDAELLQLRDQVMLLANLDG